MAKKVTLLFLAAEPIDTGLHLRLGEEIREIEQMIRSAPKANSFNIVSQWAVRPRDLVQALMRYQPTIVHFSGHASSKDGIILEDDYGNRNPIARKELEKLFAQFRDVVRMVVLNACYSKPQQGGLSSIIDYIVATTSALSDKTAIRFSACFYHALAFNRSVESAVELAKCQIDMEGLPGAEIFRFMVRDGIEASEPSLSALRKNAKPSTAQSDQSKKEERNQASVKMNQSTNRNTRTNQAKGRKSKQPAVNQPIITRVDSDRTQAQSSEYSNREKVPVEIINSLERFKIDFPDPKKVAFVMMRFGTEKAHKDIFAGIKKALDPFGIIAVRADDKQYHDDLFPNVLTYVYGSDLGIAVFERIETEEFNPNVALEVGYMFALKKEVCLLKDKSLKTLHADLVGKLYRVFDSRNPVGTIPSALSQWLKDKGIT
jgi:hypothetical protein